LPTNTSINHRNQTVSFNLEAKINTIKNYYLNNKNINFHIGDIRDVNSVKSIIENINPTHIIIASALKQIDVCEKQPEESIKTNIVGIQNIINIVNFLENCTEEDLEKLKTINNSPYQNIALSVFLREEKVFAGVFG
jgi:FlaA1/EpsC-like NDP-sugar epimerase